MRQSNIYVSSYAGPPRGKSLFFYWTVLALVFLIAALTSYTLAVVTHWSLFSPGNTNSGLLGQFRFLLGLSPLEQMLAIWVKNLLVAVLLLTLGGYLGGLVSYLVIVFNGAVLGIVSRYILSSGFSWRFLLAGLAPHGVIELSAIFLAGAVAIHARPRRLPFLRYLYGGLRWIAPLLLVAAAIEAYVTPLIMLRFR